MTFLIEIFLPLADNRGRPFPASLYSRLRKDLTDAYGGITTFTRAPAEGTVESADGVTQDDIVIFEVMTDHLDRPWWRDCQRRLAVEFKQDEILIRASIVERL